MTKNSIVFITGANTGLGLETVKALFRSSRPYTTYLGGRPLEKVDAAARTVRAEFPENASVAATVQVDIEDDESIHSAFEHVASQYGRVDVLINNAGGQFDQQLFRGTMTMREMWNKSWNVNTTGTHILTHKFAHLLLKSSDPRLLFITSGTSTLTERDNLALKMNHSPPKGWPKQSPSVPAYRASKTGVNMMIREWARVLKTV
ncbi:hypothetical protein NUU61_008876 [Penicillium alfredii]|uniref:NAD(P)-binding protein n=1 Tax=Penicillium alfredii TaxID=1506179 RepID=A0A9W9ELZ1_9EURO|nr:uncharacterized protein NUU61_008876 [Penicillium alfredii]KAJ5084297.1 hypothetical protein NUU61_008876 [Penicillium alfredii]